MSEPQEPHAVALQKAWAEKHAQLWQAMLGKKAGEDSPPFVPPPPGDRRFDHPAWAESPIYDYLRQAYLINSDT